MIKLNNKWDLFYYLIFNTLVKNVRYGKNVDSLLAFLNIE